MAGKDERLKQWWAALNEQQRAEAMRFQETGQLTAGIKESLRGAGLAPRPKPGKPAPMPSDVVEFLKMRH